MNFGFRFLFVLVALITTCFSVKTYAGAFDHSRVGIEQEYEARNPVAPQDKSNHKRLLSFVANEFGIRGEIQFSTWNKFETHVPMFQGSFVDAQGRVWSVVPEKMNGEIFDGFELIAPPLESEDDAKKLARAVDAIRRSGQFIRGASSATQFTYDVSHLVGPLEGDPDLERRNIAEFVDTILFLESSLPALYEIVSPKRYGHIVNSYAVPLAVNQKDLLNELAALPRTERTYGRVRKIFKKYESLESALFPREASHAWKFRAFNYGKLFGLGAFKNWRLPVVEVRIADLVQDGEALLRLGTVFARAIKVGSRTPQTSFVDPFPDFYSFFEETRLHKELDDYIRQTGPKAAAQFLTTINLVPNARIHSGRCEALFGH